METTRPSLKFNSILVVVWLFPLFSSRFSLSEFAVRWIPPQSRHNVTPSPTLQTTKETSSTWRHHHPKARPSITLTAKTWSCSSPKWTSRRHNNKSSNNNNIVTSKLFRLPMLLLLPQLPPQQRQQKRSPKIGGSKQSRSRNSFSLPSDLCSGPASWTSTRPIPSRSSETFRPPARKSSTR